MKASRKVVYAGLVTNLVITVTKLIVALVSGSSAMLAEFFHSTVDTGNTLLLLYGMNRSQRPAHRRHPFGHGKELYFWSFVVAVSMFAVGGVLSIWEGIAHLRRAEPVKDPMRAYLILAISAGMSAVSLYIAVREVYRRKGSARFVEFLRRSKDPTVFTVALEDFSDIAGNMIALSAIALSVRLHNPYFDGAGSILIGLLILAISGVLANESRDLLVGETAPARHVERMRQLLQADPAVERVGELLTMQLGPSDVLLNVEIQFARKSRVEELEETIRRLEGRIQGEFPEVHHLFVEVASLREHREDLRRAS